MKLKEIKAKSILVKSGLPGSDFVINPYVGCTHGCIYCYARFMKRFTNHKEPWGQFVDVKINAPDLIPQNSEKCRNKSITIASVTDPYQPLERKYKLMRGILGNLISLQPDLCIMTKSNLILRDVDLLKQFEKCKTGVSLSIVDEELRRQIEPGTPSAETRVNVIKELKKAGLHTFLFISPIFPEVSNWRAIINKTRDFVDEFWFENLNVRKTNWPHIKKWLKDRHPQLLSQYEEIYFSENDYWEEMEQQITSFCEEERISFSIYFHHQRSYS